MDFLLPFKKYAMLGLIIFSAVMVGLYLYEKNTRQLAEFNLESLQNDIKSATDKRIAENKLKTDFAQRETDRINSDRARLINQLNLANVDLSKLKAEVQHAKNIYDRTYINFNERLRIEGERTRLTTNQEPETPGHTEAERECDAAAFGNLVRACQITTIDLNTCSAWVETACATVGCEE